jgi:tetratricopeptide (TPR) repeat protein
VGAAAAATWAVLPADRPADRARLLIAIAMERRADAASRGAEAAREAEAIARRLREPTLLALALNGRFLQSFQRAGLAPQRAEAGKELVMLAAGHEELVTFEVLGHLILVQAQSALADFAVADRHATAADRLAARYELPLVGVFTGFYRALRLAVGGRRDEAESAYRAVAAGLPATGMSGMADGILPLALLSLGATGLAAADWGPYRPWASPVGEVPDSPHDLLLEARTCLHAGLVIGAGGRATMARLYDRLRPAADELAGAGSGLVTFGPVAQYLGDLAAALGRPEVAADHYRHAEKVAARAGAPQWTAAARAALDGLARDA